MNSTQIIFQPFIKILKYNYSGKNINTKYEYNHCTMIKNHRDIKYTQIIQYEYIQNIKEDKIHHKKYVN